MADSNTCGVIDMTILNRYKDEAVVIRRDDTKNAVAIVRKVLDGILGHVHERDPRFSHEPWTSGSYAARLKVSEPDEFDYDVPLLGLSNRVWDHGNPRYYDITKDTNGAKRIITTSVAQPGPPLGYHTLPLLGEPDLSNMRGMTVDNHLVPLLVKRKFKKLVTEAVEEAGLKGLKIKLREQGPAITLIISDQARTISVDLVPLIPGNGRGLSPDALMSWPRRHRLWPPADKVAEVMKIGNTSVAKDDVFWLTSFGRCELELIKEIDKDGGCRKECLRILKKLREDHWCCPSDKPALTSFHLKVLLFWQCEAYPHRRQWERDCLPKRIMVMATMLKQWLDNKMCPHYFIDDINLFKDKSGNLKKPDGLRLTAIKVGKFLANPNYFLNNHV